MEYNREKYNRLTIYFYVIAIVFVVVLNLYISIIKGL